MEERSEITNRRRRRRPLGAVAATAAVTVVASAATAGGIALLRHPGGGGRSSGPTSNNNKNSNNGFDRGHLRRRVLQDGDIQGGATMASGDGEETADDPDTVDGNMTMMTGLTRASADGDGTPRDPAPELYDPMPYMPPMDGRVLPDEPFVVTLPTPSTHNDPPPHIDPVPPHADPMDEFFPPAHKDPVPPRADPMDELYVPPPPHADPVDEFEQLFCADDPNFRYRFKGEEVTCGSLRGDRRSMAMCRKELDGGEMLGIRFCPETCEMVDECLAVASGPGGGGGGGGEGPTAAPQTEQWWPQSLHCVYSSAYPKDYLDPSIREFVLFDTKEECCSTYHNCEAEATTVPTPPNDGVGGVGGERGEHWYPKLVDAIPSCVRGTDYPEEYMASQDVASTFLHETQKDCCGAFPRACLRFFWHPVSPGDASSGCLYGEDYPQSMVDEGNLYLTEGDCEVAMEAASETNDPNDGSKNDLSPSAASSTTSTAATSASTSTSTLTSSSSVTTSAATEATAGTTNVPRAEHWWPVEPVSGSGPSHCAFSDAYPDDYLHTSVRDFVLFDTKEACCEAYHNCEAQVTTVPTPPNGTEREERWYPRIIESIPSCVLGVDYPAEYANTEFSAAFLFGTELGCCGAFPSACLHFFWYPSAPGDVGGECVYGDDYPQAVVDEGHLYVTEGECCDVWCGGMKTTAATTVATSETIVSSAETTAVTVASSTMMSTTTSTTIAGAPEPCTDCMWHESTTAFQTCTNSLSYPPSWDDPIAHPYFFFHTAEDCCATRFPDHCKIDDVPAVGSPGEDGGGDAVDEFVPLGPRTIDSFEGDVRSLPFDFGAPNPQWTYDTAVSHSGAQSVTNVHRDRAGATADLTLKITVAHPSSIQCMAIVDTSMPYELFYLEVNGSRRNTYHQRDQGGWFVVRTGLGPGKNEIVFRVENADFGYVIPDARDERLGTGSVWLDDCEVQSM